MESTNLDIKAIFGRNLRKLIGKDTPVSEVSRNVGINRTQLNRYLYGEAYPRPDVLNKLCVYFGVDARILTQPIEDIEADALRSAKWSEDIPTLNFEPANHMIFPDGFYVEWKPSWIYDGLFTQHLMLASTIEGKRITRIRAPSGLRPDLTAKRYHFPLIDYHGLAVNQSDGFAVFDQGRGTHGVAMTAFRKGFMNVENVYPGYKLSAVVFNRQRHHYKGPTVLEYIGYDRHQILKVARSPIWLRPDNVPRDMLAILELMETEDRGLLSVPATA